MSLSVKAFFDPTSSTFSYVMDDGAGTCAVIDPVLGFDQKTGRTDSSPLEAVATYIDTHGLKLQWLLETHVHADHLSGAQWLQHRFGGSTAIGAKITEVQRLFRNVFNVDDMEINGSQFDRLFADGERFFIGSLQAKAMHVPGHTPADVAYHVTDPLGGTGTVFVGDTLFMPDLGTARCDFPGGDAEALFVSIRRLLALPNETTLYLCHDYPPDSREPGCRTTVTEQRVRNIHIRDGVAQADFVMHRRARDATLSLPALMLPSVQVNMRAGRMPPAESNGTIYLKIPIDQF